MPPADALQCSPAIGHEDGFVSDAAEIARGIGGKLVEDAIGARGIGQDHYRPPSDGVVMKRVLLEKGGIERHRLPAEDHQPVAELMQKEYRALRENPDTVPEPRRWETHLSGIEMTEWPIGDGFSQMHDFLLHPNGFIYIGDNLFDRIYELDPDTGAVRRV